MQPASGSIRRAAVACAMCLALSSLARADARVSEHRLFDIDRSKNAKVVRYVVRLGADGAPDPERPVASHWVKADGSRKPVRAFQRPAYGFDAACEDPACHAIEIDMNAEIGRTLRAVRTPDGYRPVTTIDGREAYLERVYVRSRERWHGLPEGALHRLRRTRRGDRRGAPGTLRAAVRGTQRSVSHTRNRPPAAQA